MTSSLSNIASKAAASNTVGAKAAGSAVKTPIPSKGLSGKLSTGRRPSLGTKKQVTQENPFEQKSASQKAKEAVANTAKKAKEIQQKIALAGSGVGVILLYLIELKKHPLQTLAFTIIPLCCCCLCSAMIFFMPFIIGAGTVNAVKDEFIELVTEAAETGLCAAALTNPIFLGADAVGVTDGSVDHCLDQLGISQLIDRLDIDIPIDIDLEAVKDDARDFILDETGIDTDDINIL